MPHTPTPFDAWATAYRRLLETSIEQAGLALLAQPSPAPTASPGAPVCLVFSPHPDDEALVGGLALRLRQESGWRVVNVALTFGSRLERRAERWTELQASCQVLGFDLMCAGEAPGMGLEGVRTADAAANTVLWQLAVRRIEALLDDYKPRVVICPHRMDGHSAHIATALLVEQALESSPALSPHLLQSEYWNTQLEPRLMVALSDADVGRLMLATAMHAGEVSRQPYHLRLPAWLMDSARRGAERVGGEGGTTSATAYAALYGWRRRLRGAWVEMLPRVCPRSQAMGDLFPG